MRHWPSWIKIVSVLVFLYAPVHGETKAFFTSQESVELRMIKLIDESRTSIDIALFELRSPGLIVAVQHAERRGVHIRMVLDASHKQDNLSTGDVRWLGGLRSGGHGVMHNKFALFDQSQAVTGSYNWTPGAEHANYENALVTDDKETVKSYLNEFERLWERAGISPLTHTHKNTQNTHKKSSFGSRKKHIKIRIPRKKVKKS